MVDHRLVAASDEGLRLSIPGLLFAVIGPPVLWAGHLNLCYFLVTLDCITGWDGGGWAVAAATALFAAGALAAGGLAWRMRRQLGVEEVTPDERGWARFLLVLGLAGSPLFAVVIIVTGLAPLFVPLCA